jgi:8-oxo-dGTP diphosphatase
LSLHRINVVAAVIEQNEHFLLTCRQKGVHLEGLWEFPGGKIDHGETHEGALRREIHEELGADVEVKNCILTTSHTYQDRTVKLHFYQCHLIGILKPMLGQKIRWVPRQELSKLELPPADDALIEILTETGEH